MRNADSSYARLQSEAAQECVIFSYLLEKRSVIFSSKNFSPFLQYTCGKCVYYK